MRRFRDIGLVAIAAIAGCIFAGGWADAATVCPQDALRATMPLHSNTVTVVIK
jgi:hypothetical protein